MKRKSKNKALDASDEFNDIIFKRMALLILSYQIVISKFCFEFWKRLMERSLDQLTISKHRHLWADIGSKIMKIVDKALYFTVHTSNRIGNGCKQIVEFAYDSWPPGDLC